MKNLIYIITLLLFVPAVGHAQAISNIWTYPAAYKYDESVTWYFDLSGTTFTENDEIYLWIWSPSEPDAGNWENSSEFAHLSYEGDLVWKFEITPTDYFSVSIDDIVASAGFWFLLKNKDGSKVTDAAQVPEPAVEENICEFNFFPLKISQKDILGMIRTNNEPGVTSLKYKITAGSKVIEGEFAGSQSEIKGFVNLPAELEGLSGIGQIHITVTTNLDEVISDTDLPLTTLDK